MQESILIDSLKINASLSELPNVELLIDKVCEQVGLSEDLYGNVLIAVTEAVNNAIIHGSNLDTSKQVYIEAIDTFSILSFSINDEGKGFDYNSLPDPTAPENLEKENGRGIFLMRSLADEVLFNDSGSCVTVSFNKI